MADNINEEKLEEEELAGVEPKPEVNANLYDMLKPSPSGYAPLQTSVPYDDPKGSTFVANLRDSTSWGGFMNTQSSHLIGQNPLSAKEIIDKVPDDLIDHADKFMMDSTDDQFKDTASILRTELNDKALFNAYPKISLATGFAAQLIDPVNIFMPGSALYKSAAREAGLLKKMAGVGVAAAGASGVQEAILQQNKLARTAQESAMNIISSGIIGGLIGGVGSVIGKSLKDRSAVKKTFEQKEKAKTEINEALIDEPKGLKANGVLKDNDLAAMPEFVRKVMNFTPMNRLINSQFKTSKFFASTMYENNYTLNRHLDLDTDGSSIERLIRTDKKIHEAVLVDYQDMYFKMNGVEGGVFKGTRAKIGDNVVMNFDSFDEAVSNVLTSGVKHEVHHVNQAAELLRTKLFDPIKKELIRTGNLPADVSVENAFNYFMIVYNKQKIIEQGGRSARGVGTFPQAMFDGYKGIQRRIESYKASPVHEAITNKIDTAKELLSGLTADENKVLNKQVSSLKKESRSLESKKSQRPKEDIKKINEEIKEHKASIKQFSNEIKDTTKKVNADIDKEVLKIKSDISGHDSQSSRVNVSLGKMKTRLKGARERRQALKERLKRTKEDSKTFSTVTNELDKLSSVVSVIQKNISGIKDDLNLIKKNKSAALAETKEFKSLKKGTSKEVKAIEEKTKELAKKISSLEEQKKPSKKEIQAHEKNIKDIESKIKKIEESKAISSKDKKALTEEISLLNKEIIAKAPKGTVNTKGEMFSIVDDQTLWGNVEQTIDTILGHKDAQLLNPILQNLASSGGKPLKPRKITIEQLDLRDWHIKSASKVAEMYSRATLPVIHMAEAAKRFGAKDISELRTKIASNLLEEFNVANEGLTGKAAADLEATLKKDTTEINDTFDIITGVYGVGANTLSNGNAKYYNNFLKWNATRLLGFMTLSSLPDIGMHVFQGSYKHLHHGLVKVFNGVENISKQDLRSIGYAMEGETGARIRSFSDHDNLTIQPGVFSKGLNTLEQGFGNASLMNQWNTLHQNIAGTVSIHRILDTISNVVEGKSVPKKDQVRLTKLGISLDDYKRIYNFTKDNVDSKTGTRFADWTKWDIKSKKDSDVLKQFQMAVGQEIDSIVIVPSLGDKPKIAHTQVGKFLFQFKSFLMSATNKVLFSGIQRRDDINVWLGAVSMIGMGAVSYVTSSYLKGKEPDLSIGNLAKESIDKSGLLGVFMEVENIGEKLLHLNGVSRYQSRNQIGAALGPTVGAASEIAEVIGSISDAIQGKKELSTDDTKKLKRLFPYQNLLYLDKITSDIFKEASIKLGADESLRG